MRVDTAYSHAYGVVDAFFGNIGDDVSPTSFDRCAQMVELCGYPEGDVEPIAEAVYDILMHYGA